MAFQIGAALSTSSRFVMALMRIISCYLPHSFLSTLLVELPLALVLLGKFIAGPFASFAYYERGESKIHRDVTYGRLTRQKLDVYLTPGFDAWEAAGRPELNAPPLAKVLVFVPPDRGFVRTRQLYAHLGRAFSEAPPLDGEGGVLVVVLDYECVADVKKAISWVETNIVKFGGDGGRVTVMGYASGSHIAALALMDGPVPTATATATATSSASAAAATKAVATDGVVAAECKAMSWETTYRLAALMLDVIFHGNHKTELVDEILAELETAALLVTPATPGLPGQTPFSNPFKKKRSPWFLSMEDAASSSMGILGDSEGTATASAAVIGGSGTAAAAVAAAAAAEQRQGDLDPGATEPASGSHSHGKMPSSRVRESRSGFLFHASPHRPTRDDEATVALNPRQLGVENADVTIAQPDLQQEIKWSATRSTTASERVAMFAAAKAKAKCKSGLAGRGENTTNNDENARPLTSATTFETPPKAAKKTKAAPAPFLSPRHWQAAY